MKQMLLFPDPRPLVERFGVDFFRQVPEGPGVYLMRDAADEVVYVGKAKNLRQRLSNYRVANPERLRRRHLRLLRAVTRIEFEGCADESAALARESELLLKLRPRFNRAGVWAGEPRYLAWRLAEAGLEFAIFGTPRPEWRHHGPMGASARYVRASLMRLLWCTLYPERGLADLPEGWFRGHHGEIATIPLQATAESDFKLALSHIEEAFSGHPDPFLEWIRERTAIQSQPFEVAAREADLEAVTEFAKRVQSRA